MAVQLFRGNVSLFSDSFITPLTEYSDGKLLFFDPAEQKLVCTNRSVCSCFNRLWAWWHELKYDKEKIASVVSQALCTNNLTLLSTKQLTKLTSNVELLRGKFAEKGTPLNQTTAEMKEEWNKRRKSAITIQALWRGCAARKAFLPQDVRKNCIAALSTINWSETPQADYGDAEVYFPRALPDVVIKKKNVLKRGSLRERCHNMLIVKDLLRKEKSTHLVVPRFHLHKEYLIERRLSLQESLHRHMHLYCKRPDLFDNVVGELVLLFSQVYVEDLIFEERKSYGYYVSGVTHYVRYDNLPMIALKAKEEPVRIALIDLESISQKKDPTTALYTLVRIFPNHAKMIQERGRKLGLCFNTDRVEKAAVEGNKQLQFEIWDYLNWMQITGITPESPMQSFTEVQANFPPLERYAQNLEKKWKLQKNTIRNQSAQLQPLFMQAVFLITSNLEQDKQQRIQKLEGAITEVDLLMIGEYELDWSEVTATLIEHLPATVIQRENQFKLACALFNAALHILNKENVIYSVHNVTLERGEIYSRIKH